jgi:Flp pilus assembly protein TadD
MVGGQLDLFGDRHLQVEAARRALAEGRAGEACHELDRLRACYPEDPAIAAELELARGLARRLGEIEAAVPGERPRLLAAAARATAPGVRAALLQRAALELRSDGPTALLDGKPASVLLLEAGDAHAAWEAADDAVRASPRARFLGYLGDVEARLERKVRARERYRQALAFDPHDVDWDELADDDVRALPDIARDELELPYPVAWAAPVGVVLGVLPIGEPPALPAPRDAAADRRPPSALDQAHQFLAALIRGARDRGAQAIDARREMRALAPQLLAAYLARR